MNKQPNMPNEGTCFILAQFWGDRALEAIAQGIKDGAVESAGVLARLATIYAKQVNQHRAYTYLRIASGLWMLLLFLPALAHAQQPTPIQIVSNCVKEVYDDCRLVGGHWYYKQHGEWMRDDGVKEAPPVVPVVTCPSQEPLLRNTNPVLVGAPNTATTEIKLRRFDWTFLRDPRFYGGIGFSFGVTTYDIGTSNGLEATRFYRNDLGMLNKGKYLGITALENAALLPLDWQPDHRWRWFTLAVRVTTASWRLRAALHNQAVKR